MCPWYLSTEINELHQYQLTEIINFLEDGKIKTYSLNWEITLRNNNYHLGAQFLKILRICQTATSKTFLGGSSFLCLVFFFSRPFTNHYYFHPLYRKVDVSLAFTAESSPLQITNNWTGTGNTWFPGAKSLITELRPINPFYK